MDNKRLRIFSGNTWELGELIYQIEIERVNQMIRIQKRKRK